MLISSEISMAIILSKDDLVLRSLEPEDLSFLYRIENDTSIWKVSNTVAPYSKYVLKQYIENSHHDIYTNKQLRLIICIKGFDTAVGAIDLFDFDPFHLRAGVGIVIDKSFQNQGLASKALTVLIQYCFEHLKLHQVYCNVTEDNLASIQLFTGAGFEKIGVKKDWVRGDNGWLDEAVYQLIAT